MLKVWAGPAELLRSCAPAVPLCSCAPAPHVWLVVRGSLTPAVLGGRLPSSLNPRFLESTCPSNNLRPLIFSNSAITSV